MSAIYRSSHYPFHASSIESNQRDDNSFKVDFVVKKYELIKACLSSPIDPLEEEVLVCSRKRERLPTEPKYGFTTERLEKDFILDGSQIFPPLKFFEGFKNGESVVDYFGKINNKKYAPLFKPFKGEVNTKRASSSSSSIESTVKLQRKRKREDVNLEDRHIHKKSKKD